MNKPKVEINIKPCTHGLEPAVHPAILVMNTREIWYWPNITKATETEAYQAASMSVIDLYGFESFADMNRLIESWNIYKV